MNNILQQVTSRIKEPSSLGGLAILLDVGLRQSEGIEEIIRFILGMFGVFYPEGNPVLNYLTQKENIQILGNIIVTLLAVFAIGLPERGSKAIKKT